jgi:hypothetical protein
MRHNDSGPLSLTINRENTSSMPLTRSTTGLLAALLALLLLGSVSSARAAGPAWTVDVTHSPATFQRGDVVVFQVGITNSGDTPSSGTINIDEVLSVGLQVRDVSQENSTCPTGVAVRAGAPLTCTSTLTLAPGESANLFSIGLLVSTDAPDTVTNTVAVSGGGASAGASGTGTAPVIDRPAFGPTNFIARSLDQNDDDDTVAGGHPYEATTSFSIPVRSGSQSLLPVEGIRSTFVRLPPGFVGNAAAAPRCELTGLSGSGVVPNCPAASQVGQLTLGTLGDANLLTYQIFNMVPEHGYPAEFAFKLSDNTVVMYPQLRSRAEGYGLTVTVPGADRLQISSIKATFFGVPSDRSGVGGPRVPLLTNQVDCLLARPATEMIMDSWEHPARKLADGTPDLTDSNWKTAIAPAPPVTGCDAPGLASQFAPTLSAVPTPDTGSTQAGAPTGYSVDLSFLQSNDPTDPTTTFDPDVPAAPALRDATVMLPAGVAISPSSADGLDGCSDLASAPGGDQVRLDSTLPVTCPDASKIGTVVATSPLLAAHDPDTDEVTGAQPINGDIYIIRPHPGDLSPAGDQDGTFRLLIQVESERDGLNVKLPGVVTADKATGRLTARFEDSPQLPVKHLSLTFKGGDRAPLVNPSTCGAATTTSVMTPWSRGGTRSDGVTVPGTPDVTPRSAFDVSWDGKGAACPSALPFAPTLTAGVVDRAAGHSSSFTLTINKEDRQQNIEHLDVSLPQGLLANIKNVPFCAEEQAASGNCDPASQIGVTTVATGAGNSPLYVPQSGKAPTAVYFAGPYKGAPFSLVIRVPAQAGPFDLGVVTVRAALSVDRQDAHVTVKSDPLPQVLDGVPVQYRKVNVLVNRPGFMLNPTHCEPSAITAGLVSPAGATAAPSTPFQTADCSKLRYNPKLSMALTGKGQTTDNKHPALTAHLVTNPGDAGAKTVTVTLPLSMALDPDNANGLCEPTAAAAGDCPAASIVGHASAVSVLKHPLTGPVYFVRGERTDPKSGRIIRTLPKLLVSLSGDGVTVDLHASSEVIADKLVTTFDTLPDAPFSSFDLTIDGGKHGILVVSGANLCAGDQLAFAALQAQNGKRQDTQVQMSTPCTLGIVASSHTAKTLRLTVGGIGAGKISASGPGLTGTSRTIKSTTTVATLTPRLSKANQRKLARHRNVKIKVKLTYTPKGTTKAKKATKTITIHGASMKH